MNEKTSKKELLQELERLRRRLAKLERRSADSTVLPLSPAEGGEREKFLGDVLRHSSQPFAAVYPDGRLLDFNPAFCELIGYSAEELASINVFTTLTPPEWQKEEHHALERLHHTGQPQRFEKAYLRKDGSRVPVEVIIHEVCNEQGEIRYYYGFVTDISQRKYAEEALRKSEDRYRLLIENQKDLVVKIDPKGRLLYVSPNYCETFGKSEQELLGRKFLPLVHEQDRDRVAASLEKVFQPPYTTQHEERALTKDGWRWFGWAARAVLEEQQQIKAIISVGRDITERKQAEEALRESEERYRTTLETLGDKIHVIDADLRIVLFNKAFRDWCKALGMDINVIGRIVFDVFPFLADKIRGEYNQVFETGKPLLTEEATELQGKRYYTEIQKLPIFDKGQVTGVLTVVRDVTARKEAERVLRLMQFSVSHAADSIFWVDADAHLIYVNEAACRSLGYTREELLSMTVQDVDPNMQDENWPKHWQKSKQLGSYTIESHHQRKDGEAFPVEIVVNFLEFEGGEYHCTFVRDITERKRAEEALQQAQKLESLGVLAGGIAHDFNNLLMAILGNADLAVLDLSGESPVRSCIEEIEKAARRAAELTRQMLAYSGRGRFVVKSIDLSQTVKEMTQLLRASTSKAITLNLDLQPGLPPIRADAAQVQQVVMNLVTNASEAIDEGQTGIVSISTGILHCTREDLDRAYLKEPLAEGRYVYLEVADTGRGIDKETQSKIFDPFFSTKFTGRGLGLAAVLGIVRSHRGAILVEGEPESGSLFRVLFPPTRERAEKPNESRDSETAAARQAAGVILLVDDEESVRALGIRMLERSGFRVLTAEDGVEALAVFRRHADTIRGVILDLTMPRMSGQECFHHLRRIKPDLPILLSSGFDEQEATARFSGQKHFGFIQKPYKTALLAEKLKQVLGESTQSEAP